MNKTVEYILEVAKCGGITKAANNLFITPSALSKFVQTKEEELQVKLFNRDGKKFVLTYAGERYIEMLEKLSEMEQQIENEMNRIASMFMGRLRIGFQISIAEKMLAKIIPEFKESYSNLQIMLEENSTTELVKKLEKDELDMVVMTSDYYKDDMNCVKLSEGELVLAVPNDSSLIKKAVNKDGWKYPWIDLNECRNEKLVELSRDQGLSRYAKQLYSGYKIEPECSMISRSTRTALICVKNNMGITVTFDNLVRENDFLDKVTLLSVGEYPVKNPFVVLSKKNSILSEEIDSFSKICAKYL